MGYESTESVDKQMLIEDNIGRKILDAAMEIINQEGYENLTIRKVAKESGCSNTAIYVRFEDKNALARAVAALHSKPFLLILDENYKKEDDFYKNICRITNAELEKVFTMDVESVNMQMLYRGSLKMQENPFVMRLEGYIKTSQMRGEIKVSNTLETAYLFSTSFWGLAYMARANKENDLAAAKKMLDAQNLMFYQGIRFKTDENSFWDVLKEKDVNVDKALERMKGNKEAYKSFLVEFFEDPDFESLKESLDERNVKDAFDYAHGLKGMAANLGLDGVHNALSILVEILRQGSLEGTKEAYEDVMSACEMVTVLL